MPSVGTLYVRLTASAQQLERELTRAQSALLGFEKEATRVSQRLERVGQSLTLRLSAPLAAMTGLGIRAFAQWESAQISLETFLGSSERARRMLEDLARFAARTPFSFSGLIEQAQQLLAMGFAADRIIPTLTAIGDATAALGGRQDTLVRIVRALGQMRLRGRVAAQEMLQLTEAGVPAWEMLAEQLGVTTAQLQDMVSRGAVPADQAVQALLAAMEQRWGGLMARQSRTATGALSNLTDSIQRMLVAFGQLVWQGLRLDIVVRALTDTVGLMTEALSRLPRPLQVMLALLVGLGIAAGPATLAAGLMARYLAWAATSARLLVIPLGQVAVGLLQLRPAMVAASIAAAPLAFKLALIAAAVVLLAYALYQLARHIDQVVAFFERYKRQILIAIAVTLPVTWPIWAAIAALVALVVIGYWAVRHWRVIWQGMVALVMSAAYGIAGVALFMAYGMVKAVAIVLQALGWVIPWFRGLAQAVNGAAASILGAARDMLGRAAGVWRNVGSAAGDAGEKVGEGGEAGADGQNDLADALERAGKVAQDNLQSFDQVHKVQEEMGGAGGLGAIPLPEVTTPDVSGFGGGLGELETIFDGLGKKIAQFTQTLSRAWETIRTKTSEVWDTVREKVLGWWDTLQEKAGLAGGWVGTAWDWIAGKTGAAWDWVSGKVGGAWDAISGWVTTGASTVMRWVGTAWDWVSTKTGTVWDWVSTKVGSAWTTVSGWTQTAASTVMSWVGTAWSWVSTTTLTTWTTVSRQVMSAWTTISGWTQTAASVVMGSVGTAWSWLSTNTVTTWSTVQSTVSSTWDRVVGWTAALPGRIQGALASLGSILWGIGSRAFGGLAEGMQSVWPTVLGWLATLPGRIQGALSGAGSWLWGIGRLAIQGLIDGMMSMLGSIGSAARSIADAVREAFSSVLQVFSPSRVMMAMGRDVAAGLAIGLRQAEEMVRAAAAEGLAQPAVEAVTSIGTLEPAVDAGTLAASLRDALRAALSELGAQEVTIEMDGRTVARAVLPRLVSEARRQGAQLVMAG